MSKKEEFIIVRISREEKNRLLKVAKDEGVNFSDFIRDVLNEV